MLLLQMLFNFCQNTCIARMTFRKMKIDNQTTCCCYYYSVPCFDGQEYQYVPSSEGVRSKTTECAKCDQLRTYPFFLETCYAGHTAHREVVLAGV